MKLADMITLAKAGYTAKQIAKMNEEQTEQIVEQVNEQEEVVPNEPQVNNEQVEQYQSQIKDLQAQVESLNAQIQRQNILDEGMPDEPQTSFIDQMNELLRQF